MNHQLQPLEPLPRSHTPGPSPRNRGAARPLWDRQLVGSGQSLGTSGWTLPLRAFYQGVVFLAVALCAAPSGLAGLQANLKPKVDALAQPLVERGVLVGVVIGIVDGNNTQTFGYGKVSRRSKRTPDGKTVFEIGSITKLFTGLLLADMAQRKLVRLEEPVAGLLPRCVTVPQREGRTITLLDLATHTSGLPRLPGNLEPLILKKPGNPYADYTVRQLYQFLSKYSLTRKPGARYEYSNLGMGLLGHALARRAGTSYESLVVRRICLPLGMQETRIQLSEELRSRLAQGYDNHGDPAANWDMPALAGAGALRSTADDLLKFLRANMGLGPCPLAAAIDATHRPRHQIDKSGAEIAIGWHIRAGEEILWHSGETGGYHSFIAFRRGRKIGVVVLSNSAVGIVDQIGLRLMKLLAGESVEPLEAGGGRGAEEGSRPVRTLPDRAHPNGPSVVDWWV
jgi:D-alanyl-D-alanine-carboxypeptidase/D-alanyl-D-alanine-endopeptidase